MCVCVFVIKFQYFLEDQARPYLQSASESLQLQCVQAEGAVAADGRAGARALMVSLMRRRVLVDGFQKGMAVCLLTWLNSWPKTTKRPAGWLIWSLCVSCWTVNLCLANDELFFCCFFFGWSVGIFSVFNLAIKRAVVAYHWHSVVGCLVESNSIAF